MNKILLLIALTFSVQSFASITTVDDAWISKSSFNGQTFRYELIAYDAQEPAEASAVVKCEFSTTPNGSALYLSAINVRIVLKASFDRPGKKVIKTGEMDVASQISSCRSKLPAGSLLNGPVQIKLPNTSYSAN